ncbi:ATP-binding protein, partial [bacterium]|nr:ATP-binding protein [bacterium]
MSIPYEEKASSGLAKLGLKVASDQLDSVAQQAAAAAWSYTHFLGYLLEGELAERHRKTVTLSLKLSHLPYIKRLDDFDFSAQPGIDR